MFLVNNVSVLVTMLLLSQTIFTNDQTTPVTLPAEDSINTTHCHQLSLCVEHVLTELVQLMSFETQNLELELSFFLLLSGFECIFFNFEGRVPFCIFSLLKSYIKENLMRSEGKFQRLDYFAPP